MNKEHKNKFAIAPPSWTWRFIPHLFITPQHNHVVAGKKDRLIYDTAFQHDPESVPMNTMTEDTSEVELQCKFGDVKPRLCGRLYNLRITYPDRDLVVHANAVKSCFQQLKHHLDVMGAFSYIISTTLPAVRPHLRLGLQSGQLGGSSPNHRDSRRVSLWQHHATSEAQESPRPAAVATKP